MEHEIIFLDYITNQVIAFETPSFAFWGHLPVLFDVVGYTKAYVVVERRWTSSKNIIIYLVERNKYSKRDILRIMGYLE